jgi:hypothetical protein
MAAIFPIAEFLIMTTKKTMAASRKNPAGGLGGKGSFFFPKLAKHLTKLRIIALKFNP